MTRNEAIEALMNNQKIKYAFDKLLLWDTSKTLMENAKALDMLWGNARTFKMRYKLKAEKGKVGYPFKSANLTPKLLRDLVDAGVTYAKIGRMFAITRQRVEQLVNGKGKIAARMAAKSNGKHRGTKPGPLRQKIADLLAKEPMDSKELYAAIPDESHERISRTLGNMMAAKQVVEIADKYAVHGA